MPTEPKNHRQQAPQGWRMDPIPSRPAYRDGDGRIRVPVWLTKDGRHMADTEMVLLPSEAELLSEQLTHAIGGSRSILQELFHGQAVVQGPGVTVVSKLPHSA
ncbi:hypothetical protein [Streptomyces sp. cg36]|uniref:hypothetical protein n=1 Tax=Streptomyces sp. cg36 TaxID=3238798 RepID=UPI0034E25778